MFNQEVNIKSGLDALKKLIATKENGECEFSTDSDIDDVVFWVKEKSGFYQSKAYEHYVYNKRYLVRRGSDGSYIYTRVFCNDHETYTFEGIRGRPGMHYKDMNVTVTKTLLDINVPLFIWDV